MPRRPRLALPGVPLHLIQRGNNRQACFFADEVYPFYLDWLAEHAEPGRQRLDLVAAVDTPGIYRATAMGITAAAHVRKALYLAVAWPCASSSQTTISTIEPSSLTPNI